MSLRSPVEPRGVSPAARRAAHDPDPETDFRRRAEHLLTRANATTDAAARAELVIKAATLHHLALLQEAARRAAPLSEPASFARCKVEAQILGQDGERRGLRAGPPALRQAQAAYDTSVSSVEEAQTAHARRLL